jgi:coproporphyrinogen III oxidase-like Fe-S oxidoreductase
MFELKVNHHPTLLKFDRQLPVYNWYYPFPTSESPELDVHEALVRLEQAPSGRRRALYFHVPFCDTICTFCPFYRLANQSETDTVERYVNALLREIELKSQYPAVGGVPVEVIFVGGGTPSVLSVDQIKRFGEAIHRYFDLSQLKEFTFELEVKSVTREKLEAMKSIGVTRVSFGVQTFNPRYREIFNITSTVEQVRQVAAWANEIIGYVNVDMIYGMAGQSIDEVIEDAEHAMALGTTTIDFYPLNNMAASLKMHREMNKQSLEPLSMMTKVSYRMFLDEYMRARGYVPNNGYGYTKKPEELKDRVAIYPSPVFMYHDIAYGYEEDEVIAFGAGGSSHARGILMRNVPSLETYFKKLEEGKLPTEAYEIEACPEKGVVNFPYRGTLVKDRIDWARVPAEVKQRFDELVAAGLVEEHDDHYRLAASGWLFYVNMIYYLMPEHGRAAISGYIETRIKEGREPDQTELLFPLGERILVENA